MQATCFLFVWLTIDVFHYFSKNEKWKLCKKALFCFIVFFLVIVPLKNRINEKNDFDLTHVSDGSLQTEYALELLSKNRNIYSEDVPQGFFGLSGTHHDFIDEHGEKVRILNPAHFHYIYPPAFTLQSYPLYWIMMKTVGWFDQRLTLLVYFIGTLFLLYALLQKTELEDDLKYLALFYLMLNPFFLEHFLGGRNDIVILFWILFSLSFLKENKAKQAIWCIAIACVMKQTAWVIAPFIYLYLFHLWNLPLRTFLKKAAQYSIIPLIFSLLVFVPFIVCDARGLWTDMFLYPSGKIPTSYPVNGYSLLAFMVRAGYLGTFLDPYPWMAKIQLTAFLLMFVWSYKRLKKDNTVSLCILQITLSLIVFLLFSRFCQGNYAEITIKFFGFYWIFKRLEEVKRNTL